MPCVTLISDVRVLVCTLDAVEDVSGLRVVAVHLGVLQGRDSLFLQALREHVTKGRRREGEKKTYND